MFRWFPLALVWLALVVGCGGEESTAAELDRCKRELRVARSAKQVAERKLEDDSLANLRPALRQVVARKDAEITALESRIAELRANTSTR